MKIGILGSGMVGDSLADGALKHGYEVMRGSRDPKKLEPWKKKHGAKAHIGSFADAAAFSDLVVLAVKGSAAADALDLAGLENFDGKTVIDTTNPIGDAAPEDGVLQFFTDLETSLMEKLQELVPKANLVKAFSCVGAGLMVDPPFSSKPTMFICGDNDEAKKPVLTLLKKFGWEAEDMGSAKAARAIEPLCILWCIPGFRQNHWNHAFKLLKK